MKRALLLLSAIVVLCVQFRAIPIAGRHQKSGFGRQDVNQQQKQPAKQNNAHSKEVCKAGQSSSASVRQSSKGAAGAVNEASRLSAALRSARASKSAKEAKDAKDTRSSKGAQNAQNSPTTQNAQIAQTASAAPHGNALNRPGAPSAFSAAPRTLPQPSKPFQPSKHAQQLPTQTSPQPPAQRKSYAVVSGGTGGVGAAVLSELRRRNEVPILLCRSAKSVPAGVDLYIELDYSDLYGLRGQQGQQSQQNQQNQQIQQGQQDQQNQQDQQIQPIQQNLQSLQSLQTLQALQPLQTAFPALLARHGIAAADVRALYSLHGCGCFGNFDETAPQDCAAHLLANLRSHVELALYFTQQQFPNLSRVAVVSSLCAVFPAHLFALYGAEKAFLEGFFTGFAQQYKQIQTVIARPAAITATRFMAQPQMARAGAVGRFVNQRCFSVKREKVARALVNYSSGVYNIGWVARSFSAFETIFGRRAALNVVKALDLGRFAPRGGGGDLRE